MGNEKTFLRGRCIMYYSKEQLEGYSPGLRTLLYRKDHIASVDQKAAELEGLLYNIIRVSREEKVIFVYIHEIVDAMYYFRITAPAKALPLVKLFLRDGKALMEEELDTERYPLVVMGNYMAALGYITEICREFYQFSNKKMEHLFEIYKKSMSIYGYEWRFYDAKLQWEIVSGNQEGAAEACKRFLSYQIPPGMCYICMNESVTWYYIFMDDYERTMEQCRNFISGGIPKAYRERYETCEVANSYDQYSRVCDKCLQHEKGEMLERVLPLLYRELLEFTEEDSVDWHDAIVFSLYDDFAQYQKHVEGAVCEIDKKKSHAPYSYLYVCLGWMCYLKRLSHSGIKTVEFATEEPLPLLADEMGRYRVLELAAYFEQTADEIGNKFDQSRKGFSYCKRKEFFWKLAESPGRSKG